MRKSHVALLLAAAILLSACGTKPRSTPNRDASSSAPPPQTSPAGDSSSGAPKQSAPSMPSPSSSGGVTASPPYNGTSKPYAPPPPPDMQFQSVGENKRIRASEQPLSTFGVDVDTASFNLIRQYINRGMLPPQEAVRIEEVINYFPQGYAASSRDAVNLQVEGGPSPFRAGNYLVQVGLKARDVSPDQRKPAVLTFVIDVSGSMDQENRLGLVKRSLGLLIDQMTPTDQIGIVTFGSTANVVLEHTADKARIRKAIERLEPSGSTNAEAGLTLGYDLANRAFRKGSINRVILCSDGVANVGVTGPDAMLKKIDDYRGRAITLTTVGFGMGNYNDVLMEQLADHGDGAYAYVDTLDQAQRIFGKELTGTLQTVAKDAKVQVHFDPARVDTYRLVGYENREMANEEFRNDRADAGEMGAGHTVTALYEVQLKEGSRGELGQVSIRYKDVDGDRVRESSLPIRLTESSSPRLRFTAAAAEFAGFLRSSPWAVETPLTRIDEVARQALGGLEEERPEHQELVGLIGKVRSLRR